MVGQPASDQILNAGAIEIRSLDFEVPSSVQYILPLTKSNAIPAGWIRPSSQDPGRLCRGRPAESYMPKLRQFLARLRVTVNEEKTRVVAAQKGFDFLGVHFRKQPTRRDPSRSFCYCWPSRRSMQRMRDKVKALIGRELRVDLCEKIERLNPVLRGWGAYFSWLNAAQHFRKIDKYVRYKLRRWLRDKHQRRHRAFWSTSLGFFKKSGLYLLAGRIAHVY